MTKWEKYKAAWDSILPEAMAQYEKDGDMRLDAYFYPFDEDFTPIEQSVWIDIRGYSLPLYPQFPVNGYFLDFANPFKKIAAECDGKEWHDAEKDQKRDNELIKLGWTVYRIQGHECKRHYDEPWIAEHEYGFEPDSEWERKRRRWWLDTSEGIIFAIKHWHFNEHENSYAHRTEENYRFMEKTIKKHRSVATRYE